MAEKRTTYPKTVRSANPDEWVLKNGINSTKLGDRITTGEWAGSALYSLKLEERKTCWPGCQQMPSCYGLNMGRRTTRWNVDPHLYTRLMIELDVLTYEHRHVAIRLHDLGDFASIPYLRFWLDALKGHRGLRLYGFTHWPRDTELGAAIEVESSKWDRFRIRFSDSHRGDRTAHVIDPGEFPKGHLCPATHERPDVTCGNCAWCINFTGEMSLTRH